jgi:hypothetical protein
MGKGLKHIASAKPPPAFAPERRKKTASDHRDFIGKTEDGQVAAVRLRVCIRRSFRKSRPDDSPMPAAGNPHTVFA